jgi:hypothetical protein
MELSGINFSPQSSDRSRSRIIGVARPTVNIGLDLYSRSQNELGWAVGTDFENLFFEVYGQRPFFLSRTSKVKV